MATPNYDVNYDDKRFTQVESEKKAALSDLEKTYAGMINDSDKYYQAQIDASKQWADKQTQLQQEQTDFAIEKIEQQKEQAKKDYTKEQSGAYVDWQKQSDQYGATAEQQATSGLTNTGFSESSQVSMYNTYQNRVTAARESYNLAVQNYNNAITEARLQNNSVLAEIAYEALQKQLELSLQGFQYKNTLIREKADRKTTIDSMYYSRYQDVLKQINTENALAEEVRQANLADARAKAQLAEQKRQFNATHAGSGSTSIKKSSGSGSSSSKSSKSKGELNRGSGIKKSSSGSSSSVKKSSSSATVDMKSVLDLGYGPISASRLAELEKQGLITSYTSGGKIKFKKSAYTLKQSRLLK